MSKKLKPGFVRRGNDALPLVKLTRPERYVPGGWFDPFASGFVCVVVTSFPELCAREVDQSATNFATAHQALGSMYKGRCVCISCHQNEVDMHDNETGMVIAAFSDNDYDYHVLSGCGLCAFCCKHQPDLQERMDRGFRDVLFKSFDGWKASLRQ